MKKCLRLVLSEWKGFMRTETIVSMAIFGVLSAAVLIILNGPTGNVEAQQIPGGSIAENQTWSNTTPEEAFNNITEGSAINWKKVQMDADQAAEKMESRIVQTALDTMIIKEHLSEVQSTPGTNDMAEFPAGSPLYPKYLRDKTTHYKYSCDTTGQIKTADLP